MYTLEQLNRLHENLGNVRFATDPTHQTVAITTLVFNPDRTKALTGRVLDTEPRGLHVEGQTGFFTETWGLRTTHAFVKTPIELDAATIIRRTVGSRIMDPQTHQERLIRGEEVTLDPASYQHEPDAYYLGRVYLRQEKQAVVRVWSEVFAIFLKQETEIQRGSKTAEIGELRWEEIDKLTKGHLRFSYPYQSRIDIDPNLPEPLKRRLRAYLQHCRQQKIFDQATGEIYTGDTYLRGGHRQIIIDTSNVLLQRMAEDPVFAQKYLNDPRNSGYTPFCNAVGYLPPKEFYTVSVPRPSGGELF